MATLLALAVLLLGASQCRADGQFDQLVQAIQKANQNAQGCKQKTGFGVPITLDLKNNVQLTGPLPSLVKGSVLIINGKCGKTNKERCVIDGMGQFPIFTAETLVPLARQGLSSHLVVTNLVFRNAKGGVFVKMWAQVSATSCVFAGNVGGVENGETGSPNGNPPRYFTSCQFVNNTGTVIKADNALYGLARTNVAYMVRQCQFVNNRGLPGQGGGAVMLSGAGTSIFQGSVFQGNSADGPGGAVFAAATTVIFRGVTFARNVAAKGNGGAVAGVTTEDGDFASRFCSCSFVGNRAGNPKTANLWFNVEDPSVNQQMALTFCNTATAAATLPAAGIATINNFGKAMTCLKTC